MLCCVPLIYQKKHDVMPNILCFTVLVLNILANQLCCTDVYGKMTFAAEPALCHLTPPE